MKQLLTFVMLAGLLSSCAMLNKPRTAQAVAPAGSNGPFIEGIEIRPDQQKANTRSSGSGTTAARHFSAGNVSGVGLEQVSITQLRYALRLDIPVELIRNNFLYDFIDQWWNTPYRLGGTSHNGIDCSAFAQTLMLSVFSLQLPRTTREQYAAVQRIDAAQLSEGDLVFFSTVRRGVSHVGVYLHNQKFVHASTSGGVMISDLNEGYWSQRFIGAGRVLQNIPPRP